MFLLCASVPCFMVAHKRGMSIYDPGHTPKWVTSLSAIERGYKVFSVRACSQSVIRLVKPWRLCL